MGLQGFLSKGKTLHIILNCSIIGFKGQLWNLTPGSTIAICAAGSKGPLAFRRCLLLTLHCFDIILLCYHQLDLKDIHVTSLLCLTISRLCVGEMSNNVKGTQPMIEGQETWCILLNLSKKATVSSPCRQGRSQQHHNYRPTCILQKRYFPARDLCETKWQGASCLPLRGCQSFMWRGLFSDGSTGEALFNKNPQWWQGCQRCKGIPRDSTLAGISF